jgi:hypothetical protein
VHLRLVIVSFPAVRLTRIFRALDFYVFVLLRGFIFRLLLLFGSGFIIGFGFGLLGMLFGFRSAVFYAVVVVLVAIVVVLLPVVIRVLLIIIVLGTVLVVRILSALTALNV